MFEAAARKVCSIYKPLNSSSIQVLLLEFQLELDTFVVKFLKTVKKTVKKTVIHLNIFAQPNDLRS